MSEYPKLRSIWKERRKQYSARRVRVVAYGTKFITIETLLTSSGEKPSRYIRTKVRTDIWHKTFEPVEEGEDR